MEIQFFFLKHIFNKFIELYIFNIIIFILQYLYFALKMETLSNPRTMRYMTDLPSENNLFSFETSEDFEGYIKAINYRITCLSGLYNALLEKHKNCKKFNKCYVNHQDEHQYVENCAEAIKIYNSDLDFLNRWNNWLIEVFAARKTS